MKTWPWHRKPAIVVWEMTRACRLACRHCRARAQVARDQRELSTAEGERLLEQIAEAHPMLLILTGGDPSRRDDLLPLIRHAQGLGMRVAFSPSATPDLLRLDFGELKAAGVCRMSLSIDGATRETHNAFRGVSRAWDWTMEAIERLRAANLGFQINTTLTGGNIHEFDGMVEMVRGLGPAGWTIFMVVPTGRAEGEMLPNAADVEQVFEKLLKLSREVDFEIRTTEGQHFRRVVSQNADGGQRMPVPAPINDGKGFMFISHVGEVSPSGFLPSVVGNVRETNPISLYRDAPLFQRLRAPSLLKGKCGRCEFNPICGGSRARAYGLSGNELAAEPLCIYQP